MSRGRRLALLAALLPVWLAGCGNANLSAGQLRQDASRICTAADRQTQRIPSPAAPTAAAAAAFLSRGVRVLRPELTRLRGLKPPSAVAKNYDTALRAFSDKLTLLDGTVIRLQHGADPVSAIQSLQHRLSPIEAREDAAWHALDVRSCLNR